MVEVIYNGNLGNHLFQYCFGRLLAEQLGYQLVAPPIPGFPRTREAVEGASHPDGELIVLRGQRPDLGGVSRNSGRSFRFLLTGYFQRYEYYRPYASRIREWLAVEDTIDDTVAPEDVVLSIRRGRDYIPQYGLPLSYYEEALELTGAGVVHICTNEPKDPFIRYLQRKHNAAIRPGGFPKGKGDRFYLSRALDNLMFMKKFKKIVISNSSFAWWAAFLSDADVIVAPRPAKGMWARNDPSSKNLDLEVDDRRYRYLECEEYRSEFLSERLRNHFDAARRSGKARVRRLLPRVLLEGRAGTVGSGHRFEEDLDD